MAKAECKHENMHPVAFFDEQENLDMPVLISECEDCAAQLAAYGHRLSVKE